MTTLQQIGTTVAGGSCVFIPSMIFFGVAVRYRSTFIATRATARPPSVIYESNPVSASQQRGGPMLGWIPWTLSLSYDTMLTGVPGTGTREQGLSGSLLKVNLDGIVLLRFHAVCLRVCTTAAILYVVLGIPIYLSAQCYSGGEVEQAAHCSTNSYNLTNYQRTTLANVPAITNTNPTHTIGNKHGGILWRLYAIVFCFWIVALRLCHLLHAEWVQLLAMRRVYYLEYDVWGQRREELKQTLLYEEIATYKREKIHELQKQEQASEHHYRAKHFTFNHLGSHDNNNNNNDEFPKEGDRLTLSMAAANAAVTAVSLKGVTRNPEGHLTDREPWIPHPEQRDTVPNVALYSILVGGLPSLPEQAADSFNAEATIQFSKRESIDWQLSLTTTFFDHCVPNQPGFSSSVAAVTIIPGALDLSVAWRKWYAAASKLRRLRFIREQIAIRRHYDIEAAGSSSGGDDDNAEDDLAKYEYGDANDYGYGDHNEADNEDIMVPADASEDEVSSYLAGVPPPRADWSVLDKTPRGIYETSLKNQEYYKQVLGTALGTEHDTHIYDSLEFGPEQAAVYAREFAQSAAPCCPNGCHERGVTRAPIDRLIEMERTVAVEVHQANLELREARRRATRTDSLNALNLHDQQQRQQPTVAGATAHSCIGGGGVASPHSCIGGTTTAPIFIPSKRVHEEGGEESDGEDIVQSMQAQPMASRYDRRGSANADDGKKVDRPKLSRLNPDRLGAVSGDLDLEAQLYKKTDSRTSISNAQVKKSPPVDKIIKPASINRRTPSLEGLKFPNGITLEAQLAQDASNRSKGSYHQRPVNSILADIPENDSALRQRKVSSRADDSSNKCSEKRTALQHTDRFSDNTSSAQWAQVETIITETRDSERTASGIISSSLAVATGQWTWPKFNWQLTGTKRRSKKLNKWAAKLSKEAVEKMARESTYAVVTFTSRQAAVAARACLADGRGAGRWMTLKDMPIPPLADAAPGDLMTFRNCCRPVTLSINERQKSCRNYIAMVLLVLIYVFYTVPLTLASQLVNPESLSNIFPNATAFAEEKGIHITLLLSGLITALIWSGFFALCPVLFLSISNFGSMATSVANAEFKALQYYWWFMVVTAFSGQLLATMGLEVVNQGLSLQTELQSVLRQIAETIPSTTSVSWLNWIIFRVTITLPLNYLLQANSFLLYAFGLNCCSRLNRGGGPGGPVPYRIYIDSGVVLMCALALAPASPLVALGCVAYFLFCQPLLRRNLIYMYRPKFDGGGFRWPFIFDMCLSGLIVGEILLTVQMALKQAVGPTAAAALTLVPTLLFRTGTKKRFLHSFEDAALLQTSLLDGWDTAAEYSIEKREEFRRFLVDAHKAAYVPICLAGTDTDEFLTAEPAVVLHEEVVDNFAIGDQSAASLDPSESPTSSQMVPELTPRGDRRKTQHGATLRRAVHKLSIMRKSTPSTDSELYDHLNAEERAGVSPFERSMSSRDITKNVPGGESPSQRSMSDRHVTKNLPQSWIPNLGTAGKSMRSLDKATGAHERSSWISRSSAIAPEIGDLTESKGDSTSAFT